MNDAVGNRKLAYLMLRSTLGLNVLLHGVVRLVAGPSTFASIMVRDFVSTPLPSWAVYSFAFCLPWAEAIVGLAVFLGAATRVALLAGALELIALTFGTTMRQDWSAAAIQLTYAFVYASLLATLDHNDLSIDSLLRRRLAGD